MDASVERRPREDVRDYPRPPRVDRNARRARIWIGDDLVCDADQVVRVLETWHPPGIYLPREAFTPGVLQPARDPRTTGCEWKGIATYLDLHGPDGQVLERAAWSYLDPREGFEQIAGLVSVYPGRVTRCELDGERVTPQQGDFYGGWATSWITGPAKGARGTEWW